jgi:hypothetical protein
LADLEGDVDAFIAAAEPAGRVETLAGDTAERLITGGRAAEALIWLDRVPGRLLRCDLVLPQMLTCCSAAK